MSREKEPYVLCIGQKVKSAQIEQSSLSTFSITIGPYMIYCKWKASGQTVLMCRLILVSPVRTSHKIPFQATSVSSMICHA